MIDFKYLQKSFFLLVMGVSLGFVCSCGDDEEDEPFEDPTNGIVTNPTDSIPAPEEPGLPNDSVSDGKAEQIVSIMGTWKMEYDGGYLVYTFSTEQNGSLKSVSYDNEGEWVYEASFTYSINFHSNSEAILTINEIRSNGEVETDTYNVKFVSNNIAVLSDMNGEYTYRRVLR